MPKKQSLHKEDEIILSHSLNNFIIEKFLLVEPDKGMFSDNMIEIGALINLNFKANIEKNIIQVYIEFEANHAIEGKSLLLLNLALITEFTVTNINNIIASNEDIYKLPKGFLTNLASVAYSTARGIIFAKTQGSYLNRYILPLVDMNQIIDKITARK